MGSILEQQPVGVFLEPRAGEQKGPDPRYKVIWLPGADFSTALHHVKTCAKAISVMRLKQRFGVRVLSRDEEAAFRMLKPGLDFVQVDVRKVFELFPLEHGTQRAAVVKLLAAWGWSARPLQPGRSRSNAMSWHVGSSCDPPQAIMAGSKDDILITEIKNMDRPKPEQQVVASQKTRDFIRKNQAGIPTANDPWLVSDPWSKYQPSTSTSSGATSATPAETKHRYLTMADELKADLRKELRASLSKELAQKDPDEQMDIDKDEKLVQMESTLVELQSQNAKFNEWFGEMGQRYNTMQGNMQDLQTQFQAQSQELHIVHQKIGSFESQVQGAITTAVSAARTELSDAMNARFDSFEALLSKRTRVD